MDYNTINKVKKIFRGITFFLFWMVSIIATIHLFGPIPKNETEISLIVFSVALVAILIIQFGFRALVKYRKAIRFYDEAELRADKAYSENHQLKEQIQELKKERSDILKALQLKTPKK